MIFVFLYKAASTRLLRRDLLRIVVVEAMTLMADPDTDGDRKTERLRFVVGEVAVSEAPTFVTTSRSTSTTC